MNSNREREVTMDPIELKFCEVHTALFIAGTNLGLKLDPGKRTGLELKYNRKNFELEVSWNGEVGLVPVTNIVVMVPGKSKAQPEPITHPLVAGISSAQVETPYGHVHAGPGKGKK